MISSLAIASAFWVVFSPNLIHSAVSLLFTLFSTAGLYIFLYADFIAATQVVIYVGGILVLIIFGVMLTSRLEKPSINISSFNQMMAGLLCFLLFAVQCYAILNGDWVNKDNLEIVGSSEIIGDLILTRYLLPFEIISILLLGALVGAATIARKKR